MGARSRSLSMVDEHTRMSLPEHCGYLDPGRTARRRAGGCVRRWPGPLPMVLRMDNGPEFRVRSIATVLRRRARSHIPPGTPWNNGFVESFNNRLRDECLNRNCWTQRAGVRCGDRRLQGRPQLSAPAPRRWAIRPRQSTLPDVPTPTTRWRVRSHERSPVGTGFCQLLGPTIGGLPLVGAGIDPSTVRDGHWQTTRPHGDVCGTMQDMRREVDQATGNKPTFEEKYTGLKVVLPFLRSDHRWTLGPGQLTRPSFA